MPRIQPLQPPYEQSVGDLLESMMPDGAEPIGLFRTFARNQPMTAAMRGWGGYELGRELSLSMREREIVIDRVCALCRCEYEWGVHVAFFAEPAGLVAAHISSLTHGSAEDPCWTAARDRRLIECVDALHADADLSDPLWERANSVFDDDEMLDVFMLSGWYHAISYAANGARVALEAWAPRFADY